jgi:hypothetical protein
MRSAEEVLAFVTEVLRDRSAGPERLRAAYTACADVLATAPGSGDAWRLKGLIRRRLQDPAGGEMDLRKAVCVEPGLWRAQAALSWDGEGDLQAESLLRAWMLDPVSATVLPALVQVFRSGAVSEGVVQRRSGVLQHPTGFHPVNPQAWSLARVPISDGLKDAVTLDRRALILEPRDGPAVRTLVRDTGKLGDFWAGQHWIGRLACLDPTADLRWLRLAAAQPPVHDSLKDRDAAVEALDQAISALEGTPIPTPEPGTLGGRRLFYLTYAGIDDTRLMQRFGAVTSRLAEPVQRPRGPSTAPEIGIVTGLAHDHSVWNAIGRWWARCLSEAGVSCRLYDLNGGVSQGDRELFSDVISGPRPFAQWRTLIGSAAHRMLLYPEIGIEPTALYLANHRLAPVQINSWGHPVTSGLPTIDGYLGAELFDPEHAERFYSERLFRLPGIGVETGALHVIGETAERSGPPTALLCQSVFKYLPDFDDLLVAIARRVPDVRFLCLRTGNSDVFDRYVRRLAGCFDQAGLHYAHHVAVRDRLPKTDFLRLLGQVDLYLDPPSFSGFNTALMAIGAGLPVLTHAGGRLRERLAAGVLMRLGATDTVVGSRAAYVEMAASLLTDRARARSLGAMARERLPVLAEDPAARRVFLEIVQRGLP